jgi:hypothetical protein
MVKFVMGWGEAFIYGLYYLIAGLLLWVFVWSIIIFLFLVGICLLLWIFKGLDEARSLIGQLDFSAEIPFLSQPFLERLAGILLLFCLVYTIFSLLVKLR